MALALALAVVCGPALAERPNVASVDAVATVAAGTPEVGGAVVGVGRWGAEPWVRGYGKANLEDGVPATPQTVFRIASLTKQFTAAMVLRLAEQGQLTLSDPVSKYLPTFPGADRITVRHLLQHTSGLHNYVGKSFYAREAMIPVSTAEMVDYIARQPQLYDFPAGEKWSYSNSGYYLLGAIVEKVTGKSYSAALQDMVAPLGLRDTAYDNDNLVVPHRARGYEMTDGRLGTSYHLPGSVAGGAGAIRSTVPDLLRWHAALLGGKVLNPASLALMTTPTRLNDGSIAVAVPADPAKGVAELHAGMGLFLTERRGRAMIGHSGGINGFTAEIESFPDARETIVVLTNSREGGRAIVPGVLDAYVAR